MKNPMKNASFVEGAWSSNMVPTVVSWPVPDSRNAAIPNPILKKVGVPCPKCGKDIVLKKTKKGRKYYGCIGNPEM